MSEPTIPGMAALPEGDPGHAPVTRVMYYDLPPGSRDATLFVDLATGIETMVVRPGLSRRARWRAVKNELGRRAAFTLFAVDAARRAVQPAQRAAHLISQVPPAIRTAASSPAWITGGAAVLALGAAGTAVGVGGFHPYHAPSGPAVGSPRWHQNHPVHLRLPQAPLAYLGAYEPSSPNSYAGMETFAQTCGRQPNLALYYLGWGGEFNTAFATEAAAHGAIPVIQLNPEFPATVQSGLQHMGGPGLGVAESVPLAGIAAGSYDGYLTDFADAVATYGRAVVISFAPEANGTWYPWSFQPPSDYRAAWRHIVTLFRRQGADNVTWMWTANVIGRRTGPLASYWPGAGYVTWAGIDGYYRHPWDVWESVFAPTITEIRGLTSDPVLISETAIGQKGTKPSQLADLYANIRAGNYLGMIWFDQNKPNLNYRLEGDAGAVRVFQDETREWRLQHQEKRHTT